MLTPLRSLAAAAMFTLAGAASAASITLINPGPINSTNFSATVNNDSGGTIGSLSIDLSGTSAPGAAGAPLVFGGLNSLTPPPGGTASLFGAINGSVFGFNYTGFSSGLSHTFAWDPDVASNPSFGAIIGDFVGALVTATVGGTTWSGTVVYDQRNDYAIATLTDGTTVVPVPGALVLMLSGLAGFGALARRKAAAA